MEPPPAANHAVEASKLRLYSDLDVLENSDVLEISSSSVSWTSNNQKRKRIQNQVSMHEIIDVDKDDDPDEVVVINESASNCKNKQPYCKNKQSLAFDMDWEKQIKDAWSINHVGSSTNHTSHNIAQLDLLNNSKLDTFLNEYDYDVYDFDDDCDYLEGYEFDENDYNFNLAAKFDDLDLPPGIEANAPVMQKPAAERPSRSEMITVVDDAIDLKYRAFKQFDTVQGDYDHYFSKPEHIKGNKAVRKPSKDWTKTIQNEWKVLEKDLPETIYVRVYEDRMDLLRAVIVGPAGTPYHDGLFFFDAYFPPSYPNVPPMIHYHSGGLRLNPNLYACGKVCLSLLGTWSGTGCEKWDRSKSTMLQVLVSIQALVLNAKPYFNEPGYAHSAGRPHGEQQSLLYNEETFLLSCKTMLYSLRKPPKHFEDFVAGHFREKGHTILVACKAYLDGAQVGCLAGEGVQDVDEGDKSCSAKFRSSLKILYDDLLMEFTVKGANCDEFLAREVKDGSRQRADTTLKL